MSENDYDSDSELANEAKMMIDLWTMKRDEIMDDFKCHSTNVASKPMQTRMPKIHQKLRSLGAAAATAAHQSPRQLSLPLVPWH
jgi:hypothetical protein